MKKLICFTMLLLFCLTYGVSCKKDKIEDEIKGTPGNPRFNLQFDNDTNVDLDLHVIPPGGSEIYYGNEQAEGGTLDIDCLCGDCATGPNENIFWVEGTAPSGRYQFWVEYFGDCGVVGSKSNYTLRLLRNNEILQTYTGSLNSEGSRSTVYTFDY